MKTIASLLAALLFVASPSCAAASDHGSSSSSSDSSNSNTRSDSAPAPSHADSGPVSRPDPISRPIDPGQPSRPPNSPPVQPLPRYQAKTPGKVASSNTSTQNSPPDQSDWYAWSWDNDLAWSVAPSYWGDGFWGPLAFGLGASAYLAAQGSPGYRLLQDYGLQQTPCGPPGLVEIIGPNDSEICASPNAFVAAGVYYVDVSMLTLYSR